MRSSTIAPPSAKATPSFSRRSIGAPIVHPSWCDTEACNLRLAEFADGDLAATAVRHESAPRSLDVIVAMADIDPAMAYAGDVTFNFKVTVSRQIVPVDVADLSPRLHVVVIDEAAYGLAEITGTFTVETLPPGANPVGVYELDDSEYELSGLLAHLYLDHEAGEWTSPTPA